MAGFVRRFSYVPGLDVIGQIEGVVIVDLPPPGAITGQNTGVVGLVGEFPDCTYAAVVDSTGSVTTSVRPQQVVSAQDLLDRFGGFDSTIGDFGVSGGNGFVEIFGKSYGGLVIAPVNLASAKAVRLYRVLPLNNTATDTTPVVPVQGATVVAGTEFRITTGRVRTAAKTVFTALGAWTAGTGGTIATAASAATQNFTPAAGLDWSLVQRPDGSLGAKKGDILVIGYNNAGAVAPLPTAGSLGGGTYRLAADGPSGAGAAVTVEQLDGTNFAFVAAAGTVPWRLHQSSDADSAPVIVTGQAVAGGYKASDAGGYTVLARPVTNAAGGQTDGTYTAASTLTPAVVPPALTGSSADPLSGLEMQLHPTSFAFTAAVQGQNAPSSATNDALYLTAFDALKVDMNPTNLITIVWSARTSATIRSYVKTHVLDASYRGRGRVGIISPEINQLTEATVIGTASPGVGAVRDERITYTWPGEQVLVANAVGTRLKTALGTVTADGLLDVSMAGRVASLMSNLPPEHSIGQAIAPVPQIMSTNAGIQRGVSGLQMEDYMRLKAAGVVALRIDQVDGPIVQSAVTTSLTSGMTEIYRRRMADYLQDSVAQRLSHFAKLPLTVDNKDSMVGEISAFLDTMVSKSNPAAQRINGYAIDEKSGNTAATAAAGVFVIIVSVQLTPIANNIVLQTQIGAGVVLVNAA